MPPKKPRYQYNSRPGPRIFNRKPSGGAIAPPQAGQAVRSALAAFGLTDDIRKVFEAWDELPAAVRAGCRLSAAGKGAIFVEAPSCAAMHRIFYNKALITESLNRRIGARYVRDIKIELSHSTKGKTKTS
jgi:hypothetical protein